MGEKEIEEGLPGIGISPAYVRPGFRWAYFLVLNLVSFAIAGGVFLFVYTADFLDAGSETTAGWFFDHPGVASVAAATPMIVTCMIGVHYARRGARRRAAARAQQAAAPASAE